MTLQVVKEAVADLEGASSPSLWTPVKSYHLWLLPLLKQIFFVYLALQNLTANFECSVESGGASHHQEGRTNLKDFDIWKMCFD